MPRILLERVGPQGNPMLCFEEPEDDPVGSGWRHCSSNSPKKDQMHTVPIQQRTPPKSRGAPPEIPAAQPRVPSTAFLPEGKWK